MCRLSTRKENENKNDCFLFFLNYYYWLCLKLNSIIIFWIEYAVNGLVSWNLLCTKENWFSSHKILWLSLKWYMLWWEINVSSFWIMIELFFCYYFFIVFMGTGAYTYVSELWRKKQSDVMRFLQRVRCWEYRQHPSIVRITHPTRPDKARRLGYKAKQVMCWSLLGSSYKSEALFLLCCTDLL